MENLDALFQTVSSVLIHNTLSNSLRFLVPFFVKTHLELGRHVIFITVENGVLHYERICRRLGCSFTNYVESGQLTILDLMSAEQDRDLSTVFSWEAIVCALAQSADAKAETELIIILDSLSTLFALSDTPNYTYSFCRYCMNLHCNSVFISLVNTDINSPLCNSLHHYFDFVCVPKPLDLLSIANVDGLFQVTRNRLAKATSSQLDTNGGDMVLTWNLFYRLKETGIVFFRYVSPEL